VIPRKKGIYMSVRICKQYGPMSSHAEHLIDIVRATDDLLVGIQVRINSAEVPFSLFGLCNHTNGGMDVIPAVVLDIDNSVGPPSLVMCRRHMSEPQQTVAKHQLGPLARH